MNTKKTSKLLSYLLRHKPEAYQLDMDDQGWVDLDQLIHNINQRGGKINLELIKEVVASNDKQRFKLDLPNNRIRANQGHSKSVNLELAERVPPEFLYHGTSIDTVDKIRASGIKKMNRHLVHLSADEKTAKMVGSRHGKPAILKVQAQAMYEQQIKFYLSENGVWLTDYVATEFIIFPEMDAQLSTFVKS